MAQADGRDLDDAQQLAGDNLPWPAMILLSLLISTGTLKPKARMLSGFARFVFGCVLWGCVVVGYPKHPALVRTV